MARLKLHDDICDWLRANKITPADVPVDAVPVIKDGQITIRVYLRRNGSFYLINPDSDDATVAESTVTVPMVVQPGEGLARWLAGEQHALARR